jgi:hypothetical protein
VTKELDQEPKHAYDLSEDDRKKALSSLIFLKGRNQEEEEEKYKPKAGQYQIEAGIKRFGERGE